MLHEKQVLLGKDDLAKTISRMAHQVVEKTAVLDELVLIGIRSRGVYVARRISRKINDLKGTTPPVGVIDVTPFRDDRPHENDSNSVLPFQIPVSVDDKIVVLIDDVIYRGRTIRAAMEAVARLGRARRILVAALVDRGSRELPIRADIVGKNVNAAEDERVNVLLEESDGVDQVTLTRWQARTAV